MRPSRALSKLLKIEIYKTLGVHHLHISKRATKIDRVWHDKTNRVADFSLDDDGVEGIFVDDLELRVKQLVERLAEERFFFGNT